MVPCVPGLPGGGLDGCLLAILAWRVVDSMNHERALAAIIHHLTTLDNEPHRERICPMNARGLCAGCPYEEWGMESGETGDCWWAFARREGR